MNGKAVGMLKLVIEFLFTSKTCECVYKNKLNIFLDFSLAKTKLWLLLWAVVKKKNIVKTCIA